MTILALSAAASASTTVTLSVMVNVVPDNALAADDGRTLLNADDNTTILIGQ